MSEVSASPTLADSISARSGIVAGLGVRSRASCEEVLALLDGCLAEAGSGRADLAALVTLERKQAHPALRVLAAKLGIPLLALPDAAMGRPVPNPSERVQRHLGLPSLAEAAALAFGPLLVEKRRSANATCALSRAYPSDGASALSASSTASISATSSAAL